MAARADFQPDAVTSELQAEVDGGADCGRGGALPSLAPTKTGFLPRLARRGRRPSYAA